MDLLEMSIDVLGQLLEQHPEQPRQQWSRQIQPLLPEMISVVELSPFERRQEQSMDHVPKEERLLALVSLLGRDVGQHLLLKDFFCVTETFLLVEVRGGSSTADEVESDL
jgi:hypothetical protein